MKASRYKNIAVKIGSNVLTRRDGTLDVTRMSALVDQIAELHAAGMRVVIVSSGAVAAGRSELRCITGLDSVSARQLYSAVGQAKLINRYFELFRDRGLACGQVLTTKENFATRRHYLNQKHCMEVMLDNDVIPVVNENDTVSMTELMFTDNDELSGLLATMMGCEALVILSNIDGVYTGDPADPSSRLIPVIEDGFDASGMISANRSTLGRGGMATKYRTAAKLASEGVAVMIANGKREGVLTSLMGLGPEAPHTLFRPSPVAVTGVKKWIAHSEDFAKGVVRVNAGAAEALLSPSGASLLPVGVESVEGDFEKDDIVQVVDPQGEVIAWGRVSLDASRAREAVGSRGKRPLIHCDYLYIDSSAKSPFVP
ncbi:glutamate 5-kinase [uncultured Muribaculum sp.]|uniref:glutamate 5-kinase n=1 Tax=uncultured Muribaculum sp. TaxID=1918613 RepID=UPI00262E85EF|nr:glutamate 5-kinase [uncultured Muribaculum sp.]